MDYHYLQREDRVSHYTLEYALVNWLVSALALYLMAQLMPGIEIRGFGTAMIASVVFGAVDLVLGPVLRFFAFPLTLVTLGLFLLVIKGLLLKVAAMLTPGFRVNGCLPAILGALVLAILSAILHRVIFGGHF